MPVDPNRGRVIEEKRRKLVGAALFRAAIDRAITLAERPHVGGHRHMRKPLTFFEELYYEELNLKLRLILGKEED